MPKLTQLKVLSLAPPADGKNQDQLFSVLKKLSGIEKLHLRNELTSDGLKALAKSGSKVRELWLENQCDKGGVIDMGFFELSNLSELRVLYVRPQPRSSKREKIFQECKEIIARMSGGRIHLKRTPDNDLFFEDDFPSDEDLPPENNHPANAELPAQADQ